MKNIIKNENPEIIIEKLYKTETINEASKRLLKEIKTKYVYNENVVENVKRKEEQEGLKVVFDYIENNEFTKMENIYVILKIHSLLYSKVPYKNFGGSFRNSSAFISDSNVVTTEPNQISDEVYKLYTVFEEAMKMADEINNKNDNKIVIDYLRKAIDIKCRLIEIHPFHDGNGRSCRALVNLMLRKIGLPPVYIKASEKEKYIKAMNFAITKNDTTRIDKIYYKKIIENLQAIEQEKNKKR